MEFLPGYLKTVQDHTKVFIFIDPPYLLDSRKSKAVLYKHEMTDLATHKKLLRYLNTLKVNVLVSHYPHPVYDKYLAKWFKKNIAGRSRNGMTIESLYMNYCPPSVLHDYAYIGEDYRQRERFKLLKNTILSKFQKLNLLERSAVLHLLNKIYH